MTWSRNETKQPLNLSDVAILVLESSQLGFSILTSVLHGFGVKKIYGPRTFDEATVLAGHKQVQLAIVDPGFDEGRGVEFLRWLRREKECPIRFVPVILLLGHSTPSEVAMARDAGSNLVVAKPYSSSTLLKRIMRVGSDRRPYVEVGSYAGPDRRFKETDVTDDKRRQDQEGEIALPRLATDPPLETETPEGKGAV